MAKGLSDLVKRKPAKAMPIYYFYLNVDEQAIKIKRDGAFVAERTLPMQRLPNPGKDALLEDAANQAAYDAVGDLVALANTACESSPGGAYGVPPPEGGWGQPVTEKEEEDDKERSRVRME